MTLSARLAAAWYEPRLTPLTVALLPLALLFRIAVLLRRAAYGARLLRSARMRVPVIVVGNIVAGGAGKTPLTRALAAALKQAGWHPGVVSRGYGGSNVAPRAVVPGDDPAVVGDEPLILAADGIPVWIGHDRVATARALLDTQPGCDVVIADDGLQHYALRRDFEIAVIDDARGFGNGHLLPAGPLREPLRRLEGVDAVVRLVDTEAQAVSRGDGRETAMVYEPLPWRSVMRNDVAVDPGAWRSGTVHAVAGIGDPARFFALLRRLGFDPVCHAFPDHHRYRRSDLVFPDATAVLMTEKDAVKCSSLADSRGWYLPLRARIDPALVARVERTIRGPQAA
ncbi:MAG TPA: tetraacyldisaccharide 4'-kinase [Casimicrobiaceae bacterium]